MSYSFLAKNLVPLNFFSKYIDIEVIYASPQHKNNHFDDLYHPESKIIWVEKSLAAITVHAAIIAESLYGWRLCALDGFRPIEAQEKMKTFGYHPSLVSKPGFGAHPRGMAIDLIALDKQGQLVDMGTPFDYFSDNLTQDNPAARNYTKFSKPLDSCFSIWTNRSQLEFVMRYAATQQKKILYPLPQEWWDFRLIPEFTNRFQPLREEDVFPFQRMISPDIPKTKEILNGKLPEEIIPSISFVNTILEKINIPK
tara:strand:- start:812 stop:1573 length:762 start_codon:yes stop_codon:yes gene_type:complete